jgi:hypothetical protein
MSRLDVYQSVNTVLSAGSIPGNNPYQAEALISVPHLH